MRSEIRQGWRDRIIHFKFAFTLWCATPRRGLSWQKVQKFIQLLVQIEYKLGLNRNH